MLFLIRNYIMLHNFLFVFNLFLLKLNFKYLDEKYLFVSIIYVILT